MFWVNWHFHSEEVQSRFSRSDHLGFWIRTILAIFLSISGNDTSYQKTRFSRWWPWQPFWILHQYDFPYFFYLHVTLIFPTKFRVNWPLGSSEVVQK